MGRGDEDGSALVVYGTPLENSDELSARRRAKAIDKGTLRQQQPVWKQDARDSEGRRRFHGAFTGGFSAGYYNTVGSKEGWEPKTFKSSRGNRASSQQNNSAYDFMDEDERKDLDSRQIGTSNEFDTFGFTAAEFARREATQDNKNRPSVIPGPIPDEIIVPPTESIGVKLLRKMGWRQGRAIGPKHVAASSDSKREGRKAMMALASGGSSSHDASEPVQVDEELPEEKMVPSTTPSFVRNPKDNFHGLGFDPFKSAPEFRDAKKSRLDEDKKDKKAFKSSMFRPGAGTMSKGFGIGALEEMGEEDEDVYATGPRPDTMVLEEDEFDQQQPDKKSKKVSTPKLPITSSGKDGLPGFKLATEDSYQAEWFHPPVVPPDYVPVHKFIVALDVTQAQSDVAPPEGHPPDDRILVKLIEGLAILVAKSGAQFEALSKERNKDNPHFQFLFGGTGSDYYVRKLWEERAKRGIQSQVKRDITKLSASERGQVLGETPLQTSAVPSIPAEDRARLQETLNNTFMKPAAEAGHLNSQPFAHDPEKQVRYDQFIKDKFQGGLRKMNRGAQQMTEAQRAQEILEFEAVHASLKTGSSSSRDVLGKLAASGNRFTSGGHEQAGLFLKSNEEDQAVQQQIAPATSSQRPPEPSASSDYPRRTEGSWRPIPLLCKRFDLLDPYAGQAASAKPKSRIDSLTLATPSESLWSAKLSETLGLNDNKKEEVEDDLAAQAEGEKQEMVEQIAEKPVDLYKAIFSDDEEEESSSVPDQPQNQAEAANAALTRLVADDFLESLGKELGLAVPPSMPTVREPEETIPKEIPKGHFKFTKPTKHGSKSKDVPKSKLETTKLDDKVEGKSVQEANDPPPEEANKKTTVEEVSLESERHRSRHKTRKRDEPSEDRRKRKRRDRKERHRRHKSKRRRRSSSSSSSSTSSSS